jgi:predicted Rossmann fold nucleotide-binding protein DprA/Smf involved in DNA uptake
MAKTTTNKTTKKAPAKAPTKPAPAKDKPTKDEAPSRDKFGCRLESQASQINAAITNKPKAADVIATETGLPLARIRAHLKHLLGKQLIVETEQGFKAK